MKLLDQILIEGFDPLDSSVDVKWMLENLASAQLVLVDNVAAYLLRDVYERLDSEMKVTDFPNVMLPFEKMFFEFKLKAGLGAAEIWDHCGVLIWMYKPGDNDEDIISEPGGEFLFHPDVVYHMACQLFVRDKKTGGVFYLSSMTFPVNADGQIVSSDERFEVFGSINFPKERLEINEDEGKDLLFYFCRIYLSPCLFALSLMHCRNVKMIEQIPPPKLSKKHAKRRGHLLLRYYVLQIDSAKEILEREGQASTQGLKKALHICRGHFAHYGKDGRKLLFGKHACTVWIPMHRRGSLEGGVVLKDYEVLK